MNEIIEIDVTRSFHHAWHRRVSRLEPGKLHSTIHTDYSLVPVIYSDPAPANLCNLVTEEVGIAYPGSHRLRECTGVLYGSSWSPNRWCILSLL